MAGSVAYQGFVTKSLRGFEFMKDSQLTPYQDKRAPVVVFGGSYKDSVEVIKNHKGLVIIRWTGADSKNVKYISLYMRPNVINVTPLPNVRRALLDKGINCYLIRFSINRGANPLIKGKKIYTYIHHLNESKYGGDIVFSLKTSYNILRTTLNISKGDWYGGECDKFYSQCFVGLALSPFAGAGQSTVEMGLRGIKVITNTLKLPHCIPWDNIEDVEAAIRSEALGIGSSDPGLARDVESSMVLNDEGFDLKKLIIWQKEFTR